VGAGEVGKKIERAAVDAEGMVKPEVVVVAVVKTEVVVWYLSPQGGAGQTSGP
jgi:hypothetical protein